MSLFYITRKYLNQVRILDEFPSSWSITAHAYIVEKVEKYSRKI